MREETRWVNWRYAVVNGKRTKIPYVAGLKRKASSTDPKTWRAFAETLAAQQGGGGDGIGFVLGDGWIGIDLDHVRDDTSPKTMRPETSAALEAIRMVNSYTEISPSGTGFHIITRGTLPPGGRKRGWFEIYEAGRFFTVTGQHVDHTPRTVEERTDAIAELHAKVFGTPTNGNIRPTAPPSLDTDDAEVIRLAGSARNGSKFSALWAGDTGYHGGDDSAADLALCSTLAFYTGKDSGHMDRLFRQSGLMRPKWDTKRGTTTYGAITIEKAIASTTETYTPRRGRSRRNDTTDLMAPVSYLPPPADVNPKAEDVPERPVRTWPASPDPCVYRGRLGAYVQMVEPHTEAAPVAILTQVIVLFGNVIGHHKFFGVGADKHYLNLNVCLVGPTATGGKGMATNEALRPLSIVDVEWSDRRILSGLSSGEGLIWCVRDAIEKQEPVKEKGHVTGYEIVIADPGEDDKRAVIVESEFARTLRVMAREGNTLSATMRQAWESGHLRVLTKTTPAKATGAHISILANISPEELQRELTRTDVANGFANRFLWCCARRSKCLPDGGSLRDGDINRHIPGLSSAVRFGQVPGEMTRTSAARDLWHQEYPVLTSGRPGLLGAVTARAAPTTMRLACLYALADERDQVDVQHLESALALWRYCEDSARYIFGARLGDPTADTMLDAIRAAGAAGLTRTEISQLFDRHKSADEIVRALGVLADAGHVTVTRKMDTGGRPEERWIALAGAK
jgi:hypothetical protein